MEKTDKILHAEMEYSIGWMKSNPKLAGESIERFLREYEFCEITFKTYPCDGFLTMSAHLDT